MQPDDALARGPGHQHVVESIMRLHDNVLKVVAINASPCRQTMLPVSGMPDHMAKARKVGPALSFPTRTLTCSGRRPD